MSPIDTATPYLSVVVPAYNEERTLDTVVRKLVQLPHLREVVIVDDCSKDHTPEIARQLSEEYPHVKVVRHTVNSGKTKALKTGFQHTTGEIVIVQDADLEYDPGE